MNDARYQQLRETGWRRPLTDAEQAELRVWLAAHPEAQAVWWAEAGLSAALGQLPDAPVPTNFTARVLQEIGREAAATEGVRARFWRSLDWRSWVPRTAVAALAVVLIIASLQLRHKVEQAKIGRSVAAMASVAAAPSPDLLKDFEPIKRLQAAPVVDKELLVLLR